MVGDTSLARDKRRETNFLAASGKKNTTSTTHVSESRVRCAAEVHMQSCMSLFNVFMTCQGLGINCCWCIV